MENHGTNPKSPKFFAKLGILIGFITEVLSEIFHSMSEDNLQYWIGKKNEIRKDLRKMFEYTASFISEKEEWRKFYQKHFSLEMNFGDLIIPEKPTEGNWRLLIIAKGLKLNQVYAQMAKLFKCWKYTDDLDSSVSKNIRSTDNSYAIWVRDEVEPDKEFLGKSTKETDSDMKIGVILLERMIHEIIFFSETGNHLDINGVTFCSGSRHSDGDVPDMSWYPDARWVGVDWVGLGYSDSGRGVRRAVSL